MFHLIVFSCDHLRQFILSVFLASKEELYSNVENVHYEIGNKLIPMSGLKYGIPLDCSYITYVLTLL